MAIEFHRHKEGKRANNWGIALKWFDNSIDKECQTISIRYTYGSEGDSVYVFDTYTQTSKNCYLSQTSTVTLLGKCLKNVDHDLWYASDKLPGTDFTEYTNNGGTKLIAKDIRVGNFDACVMTYETSKKLKKSD